MYSILSIKSRSLSNYEQNQPHMQVQTVQDKIIRFLERKFRTSRSYATKTTYRTQIDKFSAFIRASYNLDITQLLTKIETKVLDPIDVLDEYYTFLSQYKRTGGRTGYSVSIAGSSITLRGICTPLSIAGP